MKALYALGGLGPLVFLASVLFGGARRPGFSHLADPVSALGMSGARLAGTAALELSLGGGKLALATMCVGVGQGVALALAKA